MVTIRPYAKTDASHVVSIYAATHLNCPTFAPTSEASWRRFTRASFNFGAKDFRVAELDGTVVAVLASTRLEEVPPVQNFRTVVHPRARRRGVGTRLLEVVASQAEAGRAMLQSNCNASWQAGATFLERNGFTVASTAIEMRRVNDVTPPINVSLPGMLRPYKAGGDDADWIRLHQEAYDQRLLPEDVADLRQSEGFDMVVLELDGRVAGYCHVCALQGTRWGLVESVVIASDVRGQGLSRSLLKAALAQLAAAGRREVEIRVEAWNAPAVRLYRSFGFEVFDEIRSYRRSSS